MKTYVIADIGSCHDGSPAKSTAAILAAQEAGCDAVKFQWTSDPVAMAARRGSALKDGYEGLYARYLTWPAGRHANLAARCREVGIDYLCTVFLREDVAVVAPFVSRFKVASFEAGDTAFLAAHAGYGKPVMVSVGMMTDDEAERALFWRDRWPRAYHSDGRRGLSPTPDRVQDYNSMDIRVLHCVSAYPAPSESLELGLLRYRHAGDDFGALEYDGFSDHSDPADTWTGALAVAAGASIVEAHLRLPDTDPANPDFAHAMTPGQFAEYVSHIRHAEVRVGDATERTLQGCERPMARYRVAP